MKTPGIDYVNRPSAYGFLWQSEAQGKLAVVRTPSGLFLPGGGCDPGESFVAALEREFLEEIGYRVHQSKQLGECVQYHWSEFYKAHFCKHSVFFVVQAHAPARPSCQADHELLWITRDEAASSLTQEGQRWAVAQLAP